MGTSELELKNQHLKKEIEQLINDNKRLNEELKLINSLIDNIPDTIYFKDEQCRFLKINKAQANALGCKNTEDAIGLTDYNFFNPEHAEAAFLDEKKLMRTGLMIKNKEEKIKRGNGEWFWVTATKVPMRDTKGNIIGLAGISRDITKLKKSQLKKEKKEENLIFIAENLLDNIFTLSKTGIVQYINNTIKESFGYSKEEVEGVRFAKFVPKSEMPKYLLKLKDVFFGKVVRNFQTKIICKNGNIVPIEVNIRSTMLDNQKIGIGSIRIIADRKNNTIFTS